MESDIEKMTIFYLRRDKQVTYSSVDRFSDRENHRILIGGHRKRSQDKEG